jgi:hypothetical protein
LEFGVGEIGLVRSLEISQAKAIAKFQGSGAAQEKMGFKMEANRVVGFLPTVCERCRLEGVDGGEPFNSESEVRESFSSVVVFGYWATQTPRTSRTNL